MLSSYRMVDSMQEFLAYAESRQSLIKVGWHLLSHAVCPMSSEAKFVPHGFLLIMGVATLRMSEYSPWSYRLVKEETASHRMRGGVYVDSPSGYICGHSCMVEYSCARCVINAVG